MGKKIREEWEEIKISFPKLGDIRQENNSWHIEGEIDIIDSSGILWKTFSVKIVIPPDYPNIPPIIFETKGDLPKEPQWHINKDGSCCVGPINKIYRKLEYELTLKRWLDIIVMPYFFDQVYKLEKGEYRGKIHEHGIKGLFNDYKEWWQLEEDEDVITRLKLITGQIKLPRNSLCFCGKNIKYKKCHLHAKSFENIPIQVYQYDLNSILASSK